MPRIEADQIVDLDPWTAFAVSQTTGDTRLRWDPFIKRQRHLDGATIAGVGVRTETTSKHGLTMVSEYTSFHPPDRVGMKMVEGPWFFEKFGGGWIFKALDDGRTQATWRYTFTVRPDFLSRVADPIGIRATGETLPDGPGNLQIDGQTYECAPSQLLLNFQAVGSSGVLWKAPCLPTSSWRTRSIVPHRRRRPRSWKPCKNGR